MERRNEKNKGQQEEESTIEWLLEEGKRAARGYRALIEADRNADGARHGDAVIIGWLALFNIDRPTIGLDTL